MMQEYIDESRIITRDVQLRLARKRRQLCLSYRALGKFFHVDWSTFRKWEMGPAGEMTCRNHFREMLNRYLNGEYDQRLTTLQGPTGELLEGWRALPPQVHQCMECITSTYDLCQPHPELRERLLQEVEDATRKALRLLCAPGA